MKPHTIHLLVTLLLGLFLINSSLDAMSADFKSMGDEPANGKAHYFGLNAGFTTGIGFSYRYMPARNGIQLAGIPLYDRNHFYMSAGLTYLHTIRQYDFGRALFFVGNQLTNFFNEQKYAYNAGIGLGGDIEAGNFVINLMIGYAAINIFEDFKTRPAAELGILFNF